jgi:SAM-dependent methyltransferase
MHTVRADVGRVQTSKVARFYSGQWDLLDSFDTFNIHARETKLLQLLEKDRDFFSGKKVLVAGCAYGWEVYLFHRWGAVVTGVDLYTSAAKNFLSHFGIDSDKADIQLLQLNIETLDLPAKTYDYIYCNGILHHTAKTEQALDNLIRVLTPGGEFIFGLYGSGGYLWGLVHAGRKFARVLSFVGIGPKQFGQFLMKLPWYYGVWSNRFENDRIERVVWTVENLYVPILKNYTPAQVESMLQSRGQIKILRYDTAQNKYIPSHQRLPDPLTTRLKYGTFELLYSSKKPQNNQEE